MKRLKWMLTLAMLLLSAAVAMGQGATPFVDPTAQWQVNDLVAPLRLGADCSGALTTGVYAANPADSGGLSAPSIVRAAARNTVYQVTTTAAASALTFTCDITPNAFRTTVGKGVAVTGIVVRYGVQTTALTSITSANTFATVTYPLVNGTASGTVAAVTGTPVFSPALASAQLATTTSGQCYSQLITPQNPITINNGLQRLIFEEVFNSATGTATVYQICGVDVLYRDVYF